MDQIKSVIVVGTSAGGLQALSQMLKNTPESMDAAIFVVLHVSSHSTGNILVQHLQKQTSFVCRIPEDGEAIQGKHVYIAKPNFHMLLKRGIIRMIKGPHENRWRPSIDVLFRSAAANYNSKVTGIILTGLLDDGTSGMIAIKRCGGTCIVQEPDEAEFSDMPKSVLNHVEVDYRVPVSDIGYILDDMNSQPVNPETIVPDDIRIEDEITEKMNSSIDSLKKIGTQSNYTCPDCGGTLFLINRKDSLLRYRCFTGHAYTEQLLLDKQSEALEDSLWITIRRMEERKNLLQAAAKHLEELNHEGLKAEKLEQAEDINIHLERLKMLLVSLSIKTGSNNGFE
ncbi:chemotaxis protein CheB [Mucilaginibacter arboris]|uniref:protein-glutamate methylesterase n=1 Tax=Mucilaginibacter arboris TaxID=2682090 RepID=A0A7K1SYS7_9SPHI|nr:chemotaxis protein CheB [Mucilaginibacter arboris]MVN22418.1 chemotaxis protein CheB [Mucilaginibacter arboris]